MLGLWTVEFHFSATRLVLFGPSQAMDGRAVSGYDSFLFQSGAVYTRRRGFSRFELLDARAGETVLDKMTHPSTLGEG